MIRRWAQAGLKLAGDAPQRLLALVVGLMVVASVVTFGIPTVLKAADPTISFLRIGAGAPDVPGFSLAGLVANGLSNPPGGPSCEKGGSCGVPGLIAVAQSVASSAERIDMLDAGMLEAAIVSSYDVKIAASDGKLKHVRTLSTLLGEPIHIIVKAPSRFRSVLDIKQQPAAVIGGNDQTAALLTGWVRRLRLLPPKGDAPKSLPQALQALADGGVEAVITIGAAPLTELTEFAKTDPIRLLDVTGEEQAGLIGAIWSLLRIEPETYPGLGPVSALGLTDQLLVREDMTEDAAYQITKALWSKTTAKLFANGPAELRGVRIDTARLGVIAPLHPGALRFFKEIGLAGPTDHAGNG